LTVAHRVVQRCGIEKPCNARHKNVWDPVTICLLMVLYSKTTPTSHNIFKIKTQGTVWQHERMTSQTQRISGALYCFHGAASHGPNYLFAPVRHCPLSWDARHVEKSPSPHALLARGHASPVPRAENLGRACPLDAGLDHRLALAPRAQGDLLGCPSAGGMVGRGSAADLAPA